MSPVLPIVLDGVRFEAGGRAILAGLSARIEGRGITAIVGPNGAGKSVTLRMLDGLLSPSRGAIRFGASGGSAPRRSFVFQKPGLLRASVRANAGLGLAPLRLSRRETAERTDAALRRVGLQDRAGDAALKLSSGEQQRLALARAWATGPDLLLLDEPTSALDPGATEAIEELIAGMASAGTKVLLVSHNLGQVARLAQDVLVLSAGQVVEHGPSKLILSSPHTPEARAYLKGELPWPFFAAAS
jgi:tungstate transport system ATP-binding protein